MTRAGAASPATAWPAGLLRRHELSEQLPPLAHGYVVALPLLAVLLCGWVGRATTLRSPDLVLFAVLLLCGAVAIEARRRMPDPAGTSSSDALSIWWAPIAILLPPLYALIAPVVLLALLQWRVRRAATHRRILTAAAVGLAYSGCSALLHGPLASLTGGAVLGGGKLPVFVVVSVVCGALAAVGNALLVGVAVKLSDAETRWREVLWDRESVERDGVELSTGVVVTLLAGLAPYLALLALPPVLLVQRGMLHAQLRSAARIDDKTGLLKQVTWEREAAAELDEQRRQGRRCGVLLLDVDHFKRVNDTYGHLVGDDALRAVAGALRSQLRDRDLISRFGGEEFAVLLPDVDETGARQAAERLRARVASTFVPVRAGELVRVTVSVGVAISDPPELTVAELLAAADHGLYLAKAAGRDQVGMSVEVERRH